MLRSFLLITLLLLLTIVSTRTGTESSLQSSFLAAKEKFNEKLNFRKKETCCEKDLKHLLYKSHPAPLISQKNKLAVFFSAKTGCTTLVKWFFTQTGQIDEALAYSHWVHILIVIEESALWCDTGRGRR